jgi:hypothetical protein
MPSMNYDDMPMNQATRTSHRNEALAEIQSQIKIADSRRKEIDAELEAVNHRREDLMAASGILSHWAKSLESVLAEANQPQALDAMEAVQMGANYPHWKGGR